MVGISKIGCCTCEPEVWLCRAMGLSNRQYILIIYLHVAYSNSVSEKLALRDGFARDLPIKNVTGSIGNGNIEGGDIPSSD